MYLLITEISAEYGGLYEDTATYTTYDQLAEAAIKANKNDSFLEAYEIKREVRLNELTEYVTERAEARERAVQSARAKLTAEEFELLGIK